jgi:hypothetical protein
MSVQFLSFLFVCLNLFSCSFLNINSNSPSLQWQHITIKGHQAHQVKELLENFYLRFPDTSWTLKDISEIKISTTSCQRGQVACVHQGMSRIIYLSPDFFKLSPWEKMGTLIHEQAHLTLKKDHVPCQKKEISNTECDNDFHSSFGKELLFYEDLFQQLLNKKQNDFDENEWEELIKLIHAIKYRINSL